jgi:hypothetical protein
VLEYAVQQKLVEVCVAKPGLIVKPGNLLNTAFATIMEFTGIVPKVAVTETAAAMLDQVIVGFEKEPLMNDDLVRIGQRVLSKSAGKSVEGS